MCFIVSGVGPNLSGNGALALAASNQSLNTLQAEINFQSASMSSIENIDNFASDYALAREELGYKQISTPQFLRKSDPYRPVMLIEEKRMWWYAINGSGKKIQNIALTLYENLSYDTYYIYWMNRYNTAHDFTSMNTQDKDLRQHIASNTLKADDAWQTLGN